MPAPLRPSEMCTYYVTICNRLIIVQYNLMCFFPAENFGDKCTRFVKFLPIMIYGGMRLKLVFFVPTYVTDYSRIN